VDYRKLRGLLQTTRIGFLPSVELDAALGKYHNLSSSIKVAEKMADSKDTARSNPKSIII
jgi:hypothetical protein